MEIGPGVFVSSVDPVEWVPDDDPAGEMHELCYTPEVWAGLSRFPADWTQPVRWTLDHRETILVLEGAARIEIAGGPTLELKVGDMASIPKGTVTTWHLTVPFKEFWAIT
ncbi:MAG: cupin domain-containing protein [Candidatus Limnocylindria bacterium]